MALSILVTALGDEICWRQFWGVDDDFCRFRQQHPLSFNISVRYQHPRDVNYIELLSPTLKLSPTKSHGHPLVSNIYVAN